MGKLVDLTGQRFGKWTVLRKDIKCNSGSYWICKCDCGTEKSVSSYSLRHGNTFSCGCNKKDNGKDRIIDLTGKRFTRLTVLHRDANNKWGGTMWKCKCDCGKEIIVSSKNLIKGGTKSCGCYSREMIGNRARTHGMRHTALYSKWASIKTRCTNKACKSYDRYGGKGITVCDEWLNSFEAFRDWALANGYQKGLTIDRIDFTKGYSPENCRWITAQEQQNNKSTNVWITIDDETKTMAEWCTIFGVDYGLANGRHQRGWSDDKLFIPPTRKPRQKKDKILVGEE